MNLVILCRMFFIEKKLETVISSEVRNLTLAE